MTGTMTEFELIEQFFKRPAKLKSTELSVGDDCALIQTPANQSLALSTDTLVSGVHFFADADPYKLGQKALIINLSDLAAMGAKPVAFMIALTIPEADSEWLAAFSKGLFKVADAFNLDLIGGNTTRGPLNINITILGSVAPNHALRRDQAKVDDDIYVTGNLGGAALGLAIITNKLNLDAKVTEAALARLHTPIAHVAFAQGLSGLAHAAIDISDGLAQDLQHILAASNVGANIMTQNIPIFDDANLELALNGGEDYELCFSAPVKARAQIEGLAKDHQLNITKIGTVTTKDLVFLDVNGLPLSLNLKGYQHFL